MKCFEKVIKNLLFEQVKDLTDKHQFAYAQNRSVDDATLCLMNYVLQHVDQPNTASKKHFVKILFVDFSSAFNTIQPHLMMKKLHSMGVSPNIILWINDFLTDRPQYVKLLGVGSDVTITNTGAPQGCVLSPLLFTLYTSDCVCQNTNCQLIKYADDTALVSRCINDDATYRLEVQKFYDWCCENFLELNVTKTKEMIVDFQKVNELHQPVTINDTAVEIVKEYKYLGTIIDDQFNFKSHVDKLHKKINSRLYFVRQMCKLDFNVEILELFYTAIIQSVLSFSIVCWFGNTTEEAKDKIAHVINYCMKLGVINPMSLPEIYERGVLQKIETIFEHEIHPLHKNYVELPSGRRLRSLYCRTKRYADTFVPTSIKLVNSKGFEKFSKAVLD